MKTALIVAALPLLFFGAWELAWMAAGVRPILPWRLRHMVVKGVELHLVDVRTPMEFALFHIPGAVNRPELLTGARPALGPAPVVVICMTGHRSPLVARQLAHGGGDVRHLVWGMLGWLLAGGAVER